MMGGQHQRPPPSPAAHVDAFRMDKQKDTLLSTQERIQQEFTYEYPPRIPVAMRHPYPSVNSVKQYTRDRQQEQLTQHFVSESFIPVSPEDAEKPTRRSRRRPPFSYSSLIAQAILTTSNRRMTLRDIYQWIMEKYPALYNAEDTGWQNTIRHNLSLNKCFKKVPKSDITPEENRGKGGFWTLDPNYMSHYEDGAFARGSIANRRSMKSVSRSGPSSDSEALDGSSNMIFQHDMVLPQQRMDDGSRHYPTEESDDVSSPSPSLLRMSPVTPPWSSVTIKISPSIDRGSNYAVNIVQNTPIEQTVVNLDVPHSRQKDLHPHDLPPPPTQQHLPVPDDDPLQPATVMRIDNILN